MVVKCKFLFSLTGTICAHGIGVDQHSFAIINRPVPTDMVGCPSATNLCQSWGTSVAGNVDGGRTKFCEFPELPPISDVFSTGLCGVCGAEELQIHSMAALPLLLTAVGPTVLFPAS